MRTFATVVLTALLCLSAAAWLAPAPAPAPTPEPTHVQRHPAVRYGCTDCSRALQAAIDSRIAAAAVKAANARRGGGAVAPVVSDDVRIHGHTDYRLEWEKARAALKSKEQP